MENKKVVISNKNSHNPSIPYSMGIVSNGFLFVSGQLGETFSLLQIKKEMII